MAIKLLFARVWQMKGSWLPLVFFLATIYFFWAINIPDRYIFRHLDASDLEALIITLLVALWGWGVIHLASKLFEHLRAKHWFILNLVFLMPSLALGTFFYVSYDIPLLSSPFLSLDVPLALVLFNGWSIYFFRSLHAPKELKDQDSETDDSIRIVGKIGQRKHVLSAHEIIGFRKDGIVYCYTRIGDRTVVEKSLTALEEQWGKQEFFRLNRQHLVHRDAVRAFRSLPNKSIEVQLAHLPLPEEKVVVSRHRASQFRKWMDAGVHSA